MSIEAIYVPEIAQVLLILGEDHRFFEHRGVDIISVFRACWRRITRHSVEGGSTLEQQLVRVVTGRYERTFRRKLREICLATLVSGVIRKEKIPSLYLSVAYFGWQMNGFAEACTRMGIEPQQINLCQAAEIVARIKYPERRFHSPRQVELIQRRKNYLIDAYRRIFVLSAQPPDALKRMYEAF